MEQIIFILFFVITIGSACVVAFGRNLVYSAFALLGTFLGVAGIFILLHAEFLALVQVIVYVGGILVLTVFAVMLTSKIHASQTTNPALNLKIAIPLFMTFGLITLSILLSGSWEPTEATGRDVNTMQKIGNALLNRYLLPFEVVSIVLLAVLVGAALITRRHVK